MTNSMLMLSRSRQSTTLLGVLVTARGAQHGAAVDGDVPHRLRAQLDDVVAVRGDEPLVAVLDADHAADLVVVGQVAHQSGDHVVEARAQPSAGDDRGAGLRRVEEDLAARPAGLQPGKLVHREPAADHAAQGVVEQHAVRLVDVVLGGLPQLQQRRHRRGDLGNAEGLDGEVRDRSPGQTVRAHDCDRFGGRAVMTVGVQGGAHVAIPGSDHPDDSDSRATAAVPGCTD
jgi:hypothetical protein